MDIAFTGVEHNDTEVVANFRGSTHTFYLNKADLEYRIKNLEKDGEDASFFHDGLVQVNHLTQLMNRITIEVEAYGDGHLYTYAIMKGEGDKLALLNEFIVEAKLKPHEPMDAEMKKNHPELSQRDDPQLSIEKYDFENSLCLEGICSKQSYTVHEQFVTFLEKRGFKRVNTNKIRFSD